MALQFSTARIAKFGARVLIVMLIAVPIAAMLTDGVPSLGWMLWALVSMWAALDAPSVVVLAFPTHHSSERVILIGVLALVNMALCVVLAFWRMPPG